jgi:hypothetical protein
VKYFYEEIIALQEILCLEATFESSCLEMFSTNLEVKEEIVLIFC